MTVDVVYGGPGREAPVSRQSGRAIHRALVEAGVDAMAIDCEGELDLARLRPESVVFNIIHGTYGEDGTLQRQLDAAGRPYVGSGAEASALCMDKAATRDCAAAAGLPVAWGRVLDARNPGAARDLVPPTATGLVIKPRRDGSSVGLRLLASKSFLLPALEELVAELGPIEFLVEERLPGPEFTVAVLEREPGVPEALAPIRIVPAAGSYDFAAKYDRDDTRYETVEDQALAATLCERAVTLYRAAGCRHFARIDFMLGGDGDPRLLEANTLPGFTSHSLVPKAAASAGIDFPTLCRHLVALAAGSPRGERP